jgi:DNA repair and recombination protein RAD54 and RAD54-like protein
VRNWANELDKWLGKGTIIPLAIDGKGGRAELEREVRSWCEATGRNIVRPGSSPFPLLTIVMIVSYESLRLNVDLIGSTPVGLMLCDEGHRLKNGDSQTFTALSSLNVQRRVILSGTPIQNDLTEYYSLLSFANPNLLGTRQDFRSKYELAILKGRDACATETERTRGDEKLSDLLSTVNKFIIRRTNDLLSKYLPVKYEHVVFIHLSPLQEILYDHFLTSPEITKLLRGKGSQPLKAIGLLKKLCNHPDLLNLSSDLAGSEDLIPAEYESNHGGRNRQVECGWSGKMAVLERMLARIRSETNDKIVLISNYTQTLDIFEKMCRAKRYWLVYEINVDMDVYDSMGL